MVHSFLVCNLNYIMNTYIHTSWICHKYICGCCVHVYIYTHTTHISPPSWFTPHPTPLGGYRAPSWALCAMQQLPTSCLCYTRSCVWTCLAAQMVKSPPAVQETRVPSLGCEDPMGKGMTTHSSILAWRILWTEEPGGLQSMGLQRIGHNWATNRHIICVCIWTWNNRLVPNRKRSVSRLYIVTLFI